MKTSQLILALQEADPTGELDVVVGNKPIYFVSNEPAYWDGPLQKLIQDNTHKYYNVVGARLTRKGFKVQIKTFSITEALWDNPDLPIHYEETEAAQEYYEKHRREARLCYEELEQEKKNE